MRRLMVIGLIALALPATAAADAPKRFVFDIEPVPTLAPGISAICGFPVFRALSGRSIVTLFYDANGNVVREQVVFPELRWTFSAPTLGTSISYHAGGIEHTTYSQDGTATVVFTGLQDFIQIPGTAPLAVEAGRQEWDAIVIFLQDGIPVWQLVQLEDQSGRFTGGVREAICQALAA